MAPLEELDDSTKGLERWHGAGLLWNCSIPITNIKGPYLYPCSNTTSSRPRLQHLLPKLMPRRQCPSCTRHQFISSLCSSHVITHTRMLPLPGMKQLFCRMLMHSRLQASLLNALRKTSCRTVLSYQTRPTGQSLPFTDSTKALERWHGAGLLWNCLIPITNTKGPYLHPCSNMTPSRPRLQHLLPKLMPRR
jgi:hypothetical protein